ncbi:bifunctional demethylmenaquinone methyltransferase/2-methoxy-6-polyprenyl-1,4-benzoquinol methylase UbiE [Terrarubrum flagellatum]|uniref:bifunctional demethylmenaquinone methyltransferase/2-methoxy-6-polyprenyl-1,4-benzoquinol methylase UbiE n=1 Tax=Terrirubrum flagellatum TaxID=2895980 RepID=UPI00314557EF
MIGAESGPATADTHFGFSTVPLADKQGMVDDVFHKVATRYDLMNDLMSGGLHRLWKSELVSTLNARPGSRGRPYRHLDVAGGTGDVAFRIVDSLGEQAKRIGAKFDRGVAEVTILDINGDMLGVGRERARKRFGDESILDFVQANAESLPLDSSSYDSVTIAFGIRNVPRIDAALREFHRVLRRGGRFLCLEFAPVDRPGLDRIYDAFSFNVIPKLGQIVAGDAEPYQYLVESIRRFPRPDLFASMIEKVGFRRVTHRPMTGGVVNLHSGWKL